MASAAKMSIPLRETPFGAQAGALAEFAFSAQRQGDYVFLRGPGSATDAPPLLEWGVR